MNGLPRLAGRFGRRFLLPEITPGCVDSTFEWIDRDKGIIGFGHPYLTGDKFDAHRRQAGLGSAMFRAWLDRGEEMIPALHGDFMLVAWDWSTHLSIVAVDAFSTHALYWQEAEGELAFSTEPARVCDLLRRAADVDPHALHAYLYFHMIPSPLSIVAGVNRMDGATYLKHGRNGCEVVGYAPWNFIEGPARAFGQERDRFFDALRSGVARGIGEMSAERVGCFLSGGTDSSTISGLARKQLGQPVKTFSIVFDAAAYDESSYSRLAAQHFATDHHEHRLTAEEAITTIDTLVGSSEQPFGNSSAIPTHVCARVAAEHGVTRLLAGDGGDELYGGNERYATQWKFGLYETIPAWMRRGVVEPMLACTAESSSSPALLRKAGSYVSQAKVPLPDRLQQRYNLLNHFGRRNVFSDAFARIAYGYNPLELERRIWVQSAGLSQINRLLHYDFKFTLADNDLRKVTRMCHAAGVDVGFPMLDASVVQHSLSLSPNLKLRRGELRYFFRNALRGFLPDQIIDKPKHGFGLPFGDWVVQQPTLKKRADDALRCLAARGLIRNEFVSELLRQMEGRHTGYYGTMVWILMVLELWLRGSPFADFNAAHFR